MNTPEALRIAESLSWPFHNNDDRQKAVIELRRQHAEIERLRALNAEIAKAVAAERERCARAVELLAGTPTADEWLSGWNAAIAKSAYAIRKGIE